VDLLRVQQIAFNAAGLNALFYNLDRQVASDCKTCSRLGLADFLTVEEVGSAKRQKYSCLRQVNGMSL